MVVIVVGSDFVDGVRGDAGLLGLFGLATGDAFGEASVVFVGAVVVLIAVENVVEVDGLVFGEFEGGRIGLRKVGVGDGESIGAGEETVGAILESLVRGGGGVMKGDGGASGRDEKFEGGSFIFIDEPDGGKDEAEAKNEGSNDAND